LTISFKQKQSQPKSVQVTWSKAAKKGKICQKFETSSDDFLLNHVKEPKSGIYNYFNQFINSHFLCHFLEGSLQCLMHAPTGVPRPA
ncbi:hypothetical protein, partial [uncultured Parasutterella sp.]